MFSSGPKVSFKKAGLNIGTKLHNKVTNLTTEPEKGIEIFSVKVCLLIRGRIDFMLNGTDINQ
jgi:hypothetical protein